MARSRIWDLVPQSRPNALLLTPADTIVQRVCRARGGIQTPKGHKVGPRFSEFPGRPSSVVVPSLLLGKGEGKDSRNFEQSESK